jgi:hypothetical protein
MDLRKQTTLGLDTIFNLVDYQLNGEVSYLNVKGLSWNIGFDDNLNRVRV